MRLNVFGGTRRSDKERFALMVLLCVACGFAFGCNYVWKPLVECHSQSDCAAGRVCVDAVCQIEQGSGSCRTNADCGAGVCVAQRCKVSGQETQTEPNENPDGGNESIKPDAPTKDTPPETTPDAAAVRHVSTHEPVKGCQIGSTRPCRFKINSSAPRACAFAKQTCSLGGVWSSCVSENALPTSKWATRADTSGESCNDYVDNNCNGLLNEGCYIDQIPANKCQPGYTVEHTPKVSSALHPAILSNAIYSPAQKLMLERSDKAGVLSLFRVDEQARKSTWLLDLPDLSESIVSYDISRDGTRIAAATKRQLVVWFVKHDPQAGPAVTHFGTFPIEEIYLLGWRNKAQGGDVVVYQLKRPGNGQGTLSSWQVTTNADGKLELVQQSQVTAGQKNSSIYMQPKVPRLHIHPKGEIMVLTTDSAALVYALPGLALQGELSYMSPPIPIHFDLAFHPTRSFFAMMPFGFDQGMVSVDLTKGASGKPSLSKHTMYKGATQGGQIAMGYDQQSGELYLWSPTYGMFRWADGALTDSIEAQPLLGNATAFAMTSKKDLLFVGTATGDVRVISTTSKDGASLYEWRVRPQPDSTYYTSIRRLHAADTSDGKKLVLVVQTQSATLWELSESGGVYEAKQLQAPSDKLYITNSRESQAAVSNDGTWLAFSAKKDIHVWKRSAQGGFAKHAQYEVLNNKYVRSLAFHPSKPYLISGDAGGYLRIWNLDNASRSTVIHIFKNSNNSNVAPWVIGAGFFQTAEPQDFVLATLSDNTTHAFSVDFAANGGAVSFTKVAGTLPVTHSGNLEGVRYTAGGTVVLRFYARDASSPTVVEQGFTITPKTPTGHREFNAKGSPIELQVDDAGAVVNPLEAYGSLGLGRFYTISLQRLFVWHCRP